MLKHTQQGPNKTTFVVTRTDSHDENGHLVRHAVCTEIGKSHHVAYFYGNSSDHAGAHLLTPELVPFAVWRWLEYGRQTAPDDLSKPDTQLVEDLMAYAESKTTKASK